MKKLWLIIYLACLSVLSGYLISKPSWISKMGIRYIYKEYDFIRSWWKTGLLIYAILLLLYFLHAITEHKFIRYKKYVYLASITISVIGIFITYQDFRHTLSHRWLGERSHLGAYLFWMGWLSVSIFFLANNPATKNVDKKEPEAP